MTARAIEAKSRAGRLALNARRPALMLTRSPSQDSGSHALSAKSGAHQFRPEGRGTATVNVESGGNPGNQSTGN